MRSPSIKRLCATFRDLDTKGARTIKRLCALVDDPDDLRAFIADNCPETDAYARQCYGDVYRTAMWRRTMVLHAIDRIVGTYGVEPIGPVSMRNGPPFEFLNTGDTYVATLVYRKATDNLFISSFGDVVERYGRAGW